MITKPIWIRQDIVCAVHRRQLAEHGGKDGIRDIGLLESALQKPQNLHAYSNPDLADLAASYACGITQNRPFIDGNKRTSLIICRLFLKLNHYDMAVSSEDKYQTWMALASGQLTENQLAEWVRKHMYCCQKH